MPTIGLPTQCRKHAASTLAMLLSAALTLAACANRGPSPRDYLVSGTSSIDIARAAGADEFAAVEINNARTKLERARLLAQSGKQVEAQELAEEADVDAQFAHSKALVERSSRAFTEAENGLRALREQGTLQPGEKPLPPPPQ